MKSIKFFILFLLISMTVAPAFSQKRLIKKANAAFETGEYYVASDIYQKVYEKIGKTEKGEISFKIGECFRIMNNAKKARKWYKRAIRYKCKSPYVLLFGAESWWNNFSASFLKTTLEQIPRQINNDVGSNFESRGAGYIL